MKKIHARIHARFWKYTGSHQLGHDCERYDPHGLGLPVITALAGAVDSGEVHLCGVPLEGVVVRHHKGDNFGHQVHVAANAEQWAAAAQWLEEQSAS